MKTWVHLLVSSLLALLLYPFFSFRVLLILVGGVLIDIDHYLWYIWKYKRFNPIETYKFYVKNMETNDFTNVYGILLIFHTIEFLLAMILLSFYNQLVLVFIIGLLSHYLLDAIFLYLVPKQFIVNHSIIWWIIKNKENSKSLNK